MQMILRIWGLTEPVILHNCEDNSLDSGGADLCTTLRWAEPTAGRCISEIFGALCDITKCTKPNPNPNHNLYPNPKPNLNPNPNPNPKGCWTYSNVSLPIIALDQLTLTFRVSCLTP